MTLAPAPDTPTITPGPSARFGSVATRLIRRPLALFGLFVIVVVVAAATAAPLIAPFAPDDQLFDGLTLEGAPLPPSGHFLLGTDLLGRDLLSRLLYGARTSLIVGVVANGIAVAIGAMVGVTAGFFGGVIGSVLMRFTDLLTAFPALFPRVGAIPLGSCSHPGGAPAPGRPRPAPKGPFLAPAYVARRLIQSVFILIGVSLVTFVLLYIVPADPARQIAGRSASPAEVSDIRHRLGLDRPFHEQYLPYLGNLAPGDLRPPYLPRTAGARLIA